MVKQNQWVSPHNGKWAVKGEGNSHASRLFENKADAVDYARGRAIKTNGVLIGQRKDGQINLKNSYGKDPFPPKDRN